MLSIKVLQKASRYQENHNRILEVYMELNPEVGMTYVTDYIHNKEFVIRSMQRSCQNTFSADDVAVTMEVDLKNKQNHSHILAELEQIKGLDYIEEIH